MTNSYPSGSSGVPDSNMPTGTPGFVPRRSSYASVVSGTASGASQSFQQPARSGAFSHLLNQHPDFTYDSSFPSYSGYSRYENRGYDMDYSTNGGSHGRSGSWGRGGQLPSFSSAFGLLMNGHGYGGFGGGHMDQFFVPSYLKGSKYVQKLEEAHKAKLSAHKEGHSAQSSQPGSLSTSASSINLHAKMAPSHRGMTYDLIEKAPPLEDETLAPLPSKWNNQDKHGALEVLSDGQEVKFAGPKPERDRDHEAYAIRADHPMPPQCGIYYFEVTIISRKREESSIGIGFSSKTVPLSRLPGWEPESWAYHGDDGHSFCCQNSGKHYGPPFTAGDVIGCGVNFRTGSAFFTKNGDHLGTAFREIKGKLYPSVGMKKAGEHVRVNFGQSPFIFDIDGMMSASNHVFINSHSFNPQPPSSGPAASPGDLALNGTSDTPMAPAPAGPGTAGDTPGQDDLPPLSISSAAENQTELGVQQTRGPISPVILQEIREEARADLEDLRVHRDETRERATITRAAIDARVMGSEVSSEDLARERRRSVLELDPSLDDEELAQLLAAEDPPAVTSSAVITPANNVPHRVWIDETCEEIYRSVWTRPLSDLITPHHIRGIRMALRNHLLSHPRFPLLPQEPSQAEITALVEDLRTRTVLEIVHAVALSTALPRPLPEDYHSVFPWRRGTQSPAASRATGSPESQVPIISGSTGAQEQVSSGVTGSPVPQIPANTAGTGVQPQIIGGGDSQRPISAESHFAKTLTNIQLQEEKKHIRQEIEGTSTAKLAPPLNETELIQSLVLQFLTHDGYVETARAFSEEVHVEKKALSLDPNAEVNGFDVKEDEDAGHRQRIRAAILEGDVELALKFTNTFYPNVLKDNEHVYFRLRCRKFIEMIRQGAELHNSSSTNGIKKSNGHSGDWYDDIINQEMDVDDHPSQSNNWDRMDTEEPSGNQMEYQRLLSETLAYGQDLQTEFKNDPRREVSKALEDAFALIAYEDPINAKEVSHLLDPSGRVAVAEELNSAILLSLGKSSSAALEQLYQQTSVLLEDLREGGGPGAFVNIDDFARPKMDQ